MTVANHEEEAAILDAVGKWLERDVRPHVLELEHADTYPAEMVEQMKALGLFGATIATEHGGLGLSATTYAKIVQKVSEVWMSLAGIFNSRLIMAACVQRVGTEVVVSIVEEDKRPGGFGERAIAAGAGTSGMRLLEDLDVRSRALQLTQVNPGAVS